MYFKCVVFVCVMISCMTCTTMAGETLDGVREFIVDPPTLHCLGFRWYLQGDDDGDVKSHVHYRKAGENAWREALPMCRVNREVANWDYHPYASENLCAGSIFNLEPATRYEIKISIHDPDGGEADTTFVASTRVVPYAPDPDRVLHLYPYGQTADSDTVFTNPNKLVRALNFGDLVMIHAGEHVVPPSGLRIDVSGTSDKPIVFRGAGDGDAIVRQEYHAVVLDIRDTRHLFFENLIIRGGTKPIYEGRKRLSVANDTWHLGHAFFADGATHLTVRDCVIENVRMGFYSYSEHSEHWYIADNVITGRNEKWYPRVHDNPSHTGINFYGRGHVICHNRISRFWDCIAIANYGKPRHEYELQCVAVDIYGNDLSEAVDDGIEADYGCHNIRVWNNRVTNAHTGLSAQPTYGGPVYFIGNELYNITSLNLKLHNWCTGLEIYHNTMISARSAFRSYPRWQNARIMNNLFLGVTGYAVETGSPHSSTYLDFNGYRRAEAIRLFKWDDGVTISRYNTLDELRDGTGFEQHGRMIDYGIFTNAPIPVEGVTYDTGFADLRLIESANAVDGGVVLPNINDYYMGAAPDLGCHEFGDEPIQYGPRDVSCNIRQ